MSGFKTLTGIIALLALSGCGLYGTPKDNKEKSSPLDAPWILGAPAHKNEGQTSQAPKTETKPKMDQVFSVKNPDSLEARVEKLEHEMAGIKLNLEQITARYSIPNSEPKPITSAPKKETKKMNVSQKTGVRFGLHNGKTRIVVDLPKAVTYSIDLDNSERFLLIELQSDDLNLNSGRGQGLVSNYSIDTDVEGKTRVLLNLKDDVKIVAKEALRPSGKSGHRVFIDLAKD